jgi:hypothetical protein
MGLWVEQGPICSGKEFTKIYREHILLAQASSYGNLAIQCH